MVTTDVELQLTQQLKEAGKRLSHPPTSDDDLPHVLDQTEKLLSMVDQSPNELMKEALDPLIKGLVDKSLLEHSNVDVKVAVASCLSEITRITAPEAPYNDEELKDVFQLIVSTFEDLSDKSSQSYIRRTSILETVCKVRSCVIMLDLECEELIVEMFQHFFKSIRDHHNENIISNMVDIMHLIFEESEDISVNMLKPLLSSIKNDDEGVLPVARKLGEKALQKAASILKPYLKQSLIILGDSLDNYSPVLAAICEGKTNFEQNETRVLVQQQTDEEKAKECPEDTPQADESKNTKVSSGDTTTVVKDNAEKPATIVATPNRTLKIVMSNGGKIVSKKIDLTDKESSKKPEEAVDHQDSSLTTKVDTNNSVAEVANVESKPDSNNEGKENDVVMESVEPSNSSHGEYKNEKENDIIEESKPEETLNKEGDKSDDVTMTSAENKDEENGDIQVSVVNVPEDSNVEKVDLSNKQKSPQKEEAEVANVPSQSGNVPEESNAEKFDLSKSNKEGTPQEKEAEVAKVPEEGNVEKVDLSNKEDAEVANDTGLPYKIHIRKGPRSKKKGVIKDDTPLIDVLNKKVILLPQKAKIPAVTAMSEDDKANSGSDAKVVKRASKKPDKFGSGAKSETKSGKKVGGGGLKKKRKLSGKKSGGRGSGAKRSKQSGKKVDEEGKKGTTPLSEKDNESDDSYDKPLIQSTNKKEKSNTENKEDESDQDSKAVKKGNNVVKSSTKDKEGKKNGSGENVEEKDEEKEKTLPENDEMEISPKSAVKTVTEEGKLEGTPVITSKRKRSVAKYEVKKDIKYDDSLIGKKVKVWWPDDKKYYEGVIDSFDPAKNKHKVSYVDGDQERLNLKKEKWEVIEKFSARNKKKPAEDESEDDEKLSEMITYKSKTKVNDSAKSTEEGDAEETPGKSTGSKSRRKRKRKM